jgi:hypothetical protein
VAHVATLTPEQRQRLPDYIRPCRVALDHIHATLKNSTTDPEEREQRASAARRLKDAIAAMTFLLGPQWVPGSLAAVLQTHRDYGTAGMPQELWELRASELDGQARADLDALQTAAIAASPLDGDEGWDDLDAGVRGLLQHMNGREQADLCELCREVWRKEYADVTQGALKTRISKANHFLRKCESKRSLRMVTREMILRWQ